MIAKMTVKLLASSHITETEKAIKASILHDKVRGMVGVFNINESVLLNSAPV